MSNSNDAGMVIGPIVVSLLLIFFTFSCSNNRVGKNFDKSLRGHTYICVNGEEYKIEDIQSTDVKWGYNQPDSITLYMKDGTVVYAQSGAYTVK
jgi:hypothetical protein